MTPDLKATSDSIHLLRKRLSELLPDMASVAQRFPWSLLSAFLLTVYLLFDLHKSVPWSDDIRLVRLPVALISAFCWSFAATLYAETTGYEASARHALVVAGLPVIGLLAVLANVPPLARSSPTE